MAGFKPSADDDMSEQRRQKPAGVDPAMFAAAALPPYRQAEDPGAGGQDAQDEIDAARRAAARLDEIYGPSPVLKRRMPFMLVMSLIFIFGACAGIGIATWMSAGASRPVIHGVAGSTAPVVAAVSTSAEDEQSRALRGIRASELPYDGLGPGAAEEAPAAAVPQAYAPAPAPAPTAAAAETPAATRKADGAGQKAGGDRTDESKVAEAAKPGKEPREQRKSRVRATADKEAERLRKQADEELSKNNRLAANQSRDVDPATARIRLMKARLAQCDSSSNIIKREQCRWRLCGGKWGKNGCPSYTAQNSLY